MLSPLLTGNKGIKILKAVISGKCVGLTWWRSFILIIVCQLNKMLFNSIACVTIINGKMYVLLKVCLLKLHWWAKLGYSTYRKRNNWSTLSVIGCRWVEAEFLDVIGTKVCDRWSMKHLLFFSLWKRIWWGFLVAVGSWMSVVGCWDFDFRV